MSYEPTRDSGALYLGRIITIFIEKSPGKNRCPDAYSGFFRKGGYRMRAYVIGVDKNPGPRFTGRVIALIYEQGDDLNPQKRPEAMVLAPATVKPNQAEISEKIYTKDESLRHRIEPLYHKSCGAIVYRRVEDELEFLILNEQHSEKWGFPKGHMEHSESEQETASREIFEEAGFHPEFQDDFREEIHYRISASGEKSVVYFLSEYDGPITVRQDEIAAYKWITTKSARQYLHRSNLIRVIGKAQETVLAGKSE